MSDELSVLQPHSWASSIFGNELNSGLLQSFLHCMDGSLRGIAGKDENALSRLWREKRGEAAVLGLSAVLIVQLA